MEIGDMYTQDGIDYKVVEIINGEMVCTRLTELDSQGKPKLTDNGKEASKTKEKTPFQMTNAELKEYCDENGVAWANGEKRQEILKKLAGN